MNRKLYEAKQDLLEAKEEYRKAYKNWKRVNEYDEDECVNEFEDDSECSETDFDGWCSALDSGACVWVPTNCAEKFVAYCRNNGVRCSGGIVTDSFQCFYSNK